jgi:hypothetical protein
MPCCPCSLNFMGRVPFSTWPDYVAQLFLCPSSRRCRTCLLCTFTRNACHLLKLVSVGCGAEKPRQASTEEDILTPKHNRPLTRQCREILPPKAAEATAFKKEMGGGYTCKPNRTKDGSYSSEQHAVPFHQELRCGPSRKH